MKQSGGWGSWVFDINGTANNLTHLEVRFGRGGFQEARGSGPGGYGGSFFLSHRLELLDSPREWHLDAGDSKEEGVLYVGVATGEDPPSSLIAPCVEQLFVVEGSLASPVVNVRISGLTIRHAAPTYMRGYTVPSGGDYAVHRGAAVHLNGTRNCTVDHCLFDSVGGNAVWLTDYNRHAMVTANEMRHLGENGVGMTGSTEWVDGRNGNQPRFNEISGNLIHHVGLYTKQACAIFSAVSCQNLIEKNILFHGPRALLNVNDGFGGATTIRNNLFFASLLETHDHGPFNSWDRQPFLTTVRNGSASLVPAYNHIDANLFFSGNPYAIDTDDGSDMYNVTANVVYQTPLFKTDYGGHTKSFSRNVAILTGVDPHGTGNHGSCGCPHTGSGGGLSPTDSFVGNQCVGLASTVECGVDEKQHGVIGGNTYYFDGSNSSGAVCPSSPSALEKGSKILPLPDNAAIIALAKHALGMPN
jgi:hypothetical protein